MTLCMYDVKAPSRYSSFTANIALGSAHFYDGTTQQMFLLLVSGNGFG